MFHTTAGNQPHPEYDNGAQRPATWIRPNPERIENGVQELIEGMRAARSMSDLIADDAWDWQPSAFTRKQWRHFVEAVLRADARWRWEHPQVPT